MLRTLNYDKHTPTSVLYIPVITSQSFETLSTTTDDHYLFYPRISKFSICIAKKRPTITWSSPLYQHVLHLNIEISSDSSIWNSLLNIGKNNILSFIDLIRENYFFIHVKINLFYLLTIFVSVSINETNDDDNDDPQKIVTCLSQFVYLPNVIGVEFGSTFDISRWREIELILQYVDILLYKQKYI